MANFEDIAKKAFYMGVGFASYAQEKANDTLKDVRVQAQKLAEEMAERGEMSTEEARKFVDDLVEQAQAQQETVSGNTPTDEREPRRIEIVDEVESTPQSKPNSTNSTNSTNSIKENTAKSTGGDDLRQQVQSLQEELRRLRKEM